jgi:NAD(P)-dependent dehydrogenase (short-subunit alcohol dehydrogenase family)
MSVVGKLDGKVAIAQDLGPHGITANGIAPGTIATGRMMQSVIPGSSRANVDPAARVALRRVATVEDCARVVETIIPIDGGFDGYAALRVKNKQHERDLR